MALVWNRFLYDLSRLLKKLELLIVEISSNDEALSRSIPRNINPCKDYSFLFGLGHTLFETKMKMSTLNNKLFRLSLFRFVSKITKQFL